MKNKNYLQKAIEDGKKLNKELGREYFDNFGMENLKSLEVGEIPSQTFTMIEGSYGTSNVKPDVKSMEKSANLLLK